MDPQARVTQAQRALSAATASAKSAAKDLKNLSPTTPDLRFAAEVRQKDARERKQACLRSLNRALSALDVELQATNQPQASTRNTRKEQGWEQARNHGRNQSRRQGSGAYLRSSSMSEAQVAASRSRLSSRHRSGVDSTDSDTNRLQARSRRRSPSLPDFMPNQSGSSTSRPRASSAAPRLSLHSADLNHHLSRSSLRADETLGSLLRHSGYRSSSRRSSLRPRPSSDAVDEGHGNCARHNLRSSSLHPRTSAEDTDERPSYHDPQNVRRWLDSRPYHFDPINAPAGLQQPSAICRNTRPRHPHLHVAWAPLP